MGGGGRGGGACRLFFMKAIVARVVCVMHISMVIFIFLPFLVHVQKGRIFCVKTLLFDRRDC